MLLETIAVSCDVLLCFCVLLFHQLFGDWESHLRRIMKLIAGGGLSITGSHNMCGDYLYSGHTVILTLTYLFIKECECPAVLLLCNSFLAEEFLFAHWQTQLKLKYLHFPP